MNIPKLYPLKLIRKGCLDCCGGSVKSVRFCADTECYFWYLRLGKYPRTLIKEDRKKYEQLFDKANFEKGGMFSPKEEVSSFELKE